MRAKRAHAAAQRSAKAKKQRVAFRQESASAMPRAKAAPLEGNGGGESVAGAQRAAQTLKRCAGRKEAQSSAP